MSADASEDAGRNKGWAELSSAEQAAAAVLGFNEGAWDAGETPVPCRQSWESLSHNPVSYTHLTLPTKA